MSPAIITTTGSNGVNHHTNSHPKSKQLHGFGTRAIHVGSEANSATGAVIPPISLSTTYKQEAIGVHKVRFRELSCTEYNI